jgi:hypothetical protein
MKTYTSSELSNEDYHGHVGSFSSSSLKVALEDIELFHKQCVLKEGEKLHIPAFDTGTYFHTKVLEPHLLNDECVVFDGVRRGKKWDEFYKEHKGKAIVSKTQAATADKLAELIQHSHVATTLIELCEPEVSCFVEVLVDFVNKRIFSRDLTLEFTMNGVKVLDVDDFVEADESSQYLELKVRADALCKADGYVLDLKSTTGNCKNAPAVKKKISMYQYDLSASMYLDLFSAAYGKTFDKFYWTFASKDKHNCKTYLASEDNVRVGRAKWHKAVFLIAEAKYNDYLVEETVDILEPETYQKFEWLKEEKR